MKKIEYTAPAVKVVRLKTMTKLMQTSSVGLGGPYNGTSTIEDKEDDEDSFGW